MISFCSFLCLGCAAFSYEPINTHVFQARSARVCVCDLLLLACAPYTAIFRKLAAISIAKLSRRCLLDWDNQDRRWPASRGASRLADIKKYSAKCLSVCVQPPPLCFRFTPLSSLLLHLQFYLPWKPKTQEVVEADPRESKGSRYSEACVKFWLLFQYLNIFYVCFTILTKFAVFILMIIMSVHSKNQPASSKIKLAFPFLFIYNEGNVCKWFLKLSCNSDMSCNKILWL